MTRAFTDTEAKRERVPMLVGLVGPTGSGKTYSALRLAVGMQRVTGGKIFYVDTEARRALHYADEFDFQHVEMTEPFSPLDYQQVIEFCVMKGATILVVDSMSHEHEGPGGVLEMHEAELDRMAGDNMAKRQRVNIGAWVKPKQQRRKLINTVLRCGVNAIFCFRAKEKLKIISGKEPVALGWQAIAGDEFVYEMLVNCLFYPGAEGVPNWAPDEAGERVMTKRPKRLAAIFKDKEPLSENTGEALARWAAGDEPPARPAARGGELDLAVAAMKAAVDQQQLDVARLGWGRLGWGADEVSQIQKAVAEARARIDGSTDDPGKTGTDEEMGHLLAEMDQHRDKMPGKGAKLTGLTAADAEPICGNPTGDHPCRLVRGHEGAHLSTSKIDGVEQEPICGRDLGEQGMYCQAPKGHPWDCITGETTEEKLGTEGATSDT